MPRRLPALLLCVVWVSASPGNAAAAEPPAVESLIEHARRVHHADHDAWGKYAFDRHVTRRSTDQEGTVTFQEELDFHLVPAGKVYDEELYEIDGHAPTAKEIREHRQARRFTKHRDQIATFELDNPIGEDLALGPFILDQPHRLVGEEEVDGVRCWRVAFDARPEPPNLAAKEKLKYALEGSACLAVDGAHIVEMALRSTRSVKKWPAELSHMEMRFEKRPVDGVWLPRLIEVRSQAKVPGEDLRKWNEYRYSDYRRVVD